MRRNHGIVRHPQTRENLPGEEKMIWNREHDKLIAEKSKGLPPDWIERNGEIYHATGYISDPLPRYNTDIASILWVVEAWVEAKPDSRWFDIGRWLPTGDDPKYLVVVSEFVAENDRPTNFIGKHNSMAAALSAALYEAITHVPLEQATE